MHGWIGLKLDKRSRGKAASDQSRASEAAVPDLSGFSYPWIPFSSHDGTCKLSGKAERETRARVQGERQAPVPELDHSGCLLQVLLLPGVAPWGPRAIRG